MVGIRVKVANIVLIFVVIFVVCWAPRHAYLLSWHYFDICYNAYWHVFKAAGLCLTFVYSAINPFALYVINDQFRKYFDHYLCGRYVMLSSFANTTEGQQYKHSIDT